jgi:asparagine synthase (glutamine-hydrolysing)
VPIGAFLSGGIDSATIVALASRELEQPLTTLTVTFDETDVSEAG